MLERLRKRGLGQVEDVCGPEGLLPHDRAENENMEPMVPTAPLPNIILTALDLRPDPVEMPEKALIDELQANELAIRALQLRQHMLHLQKQGRQPGE